MNKSELIASKINQALISASIGNEKLVVGIDGYAGSGKTTITKTLKKLNKDIEIVHLDDFIKHWQLRKKLIESAKDKPSAFEYQWYRYTELEKLIRTFKKRASGQTYHKIFSFKDNDFHKKPKSFSLSKKILVVEGIFLLHPDHRVNKLFDYTIYLDPIIHKADKRRVVRDKKEFGKNFLPDNHPENWVQYYKTAYLRYIKNHKPQKIADMVFKV